MSSKRIKAQMRIFRELETQLMTQAERLGIRDRYSPLRLKELEYDALKKHLIAFYQERANLEYEMQMLGTDKKETLIKLERLEVYIKRAERMGEMFESDIQKMIAKLSPDSEKAKKVIASETISVPNC